VGDPTLRTHLVDPVGAPLRDVFRGAPSGTPLAGPTLAYRLVRPFLGDPLQRPPVVDPSWGNTQVLPPGGPPGTLLV
jgi:hypothetical protein